MVLQKVLMAPEVEQREFMFWFNFLQNLRERYMKKQTNKKNNRNSTIKVLFFYMCKFTFRFVFHSSALEARIFFFFNFSLKPSCKL